MAKPTQNLFESIKKAVPDFRNDKFLEDDRFLYDDIKNILENYNEFSAIADGLI